MYQYPAPPAGCSFYDYATVLPAHYAYYPSNFGTPHVSRPKRQAHWASYSAAKDSSGGWHSMPPGYASYYDAVHSYPSPPHKHEKVSAFYGESHYKAAGGRAPRRPSMPSASGDPFYSYHQPASPLQSQKRPFFNVVVDNAFDTLPRSATHVPPRYSRASAWAGGRRRFDDGAGTPARQNAGQYQFYRKQKPTTDQSFYYNQVPVYNATDSAMRSRARRASTSTRIPQKPKPTSSLPKHPKATEADAIRNGIPDGYSIKNWDPSEEPILLLGSVFDANSLGKWIYDWTVFHHGASAPMADVAGDLWLLLIKLAGKVKRARECGSRIRNAETREMVEDFLDGGERLWDRFEKLLKACEHFMWKAAKRETGRCGPVMMGRNAGCEFVDSIFGRDRELENTERLMNSIRLWDMRFDANCDEILRRMTAG
ncbi:hypothetical protein PABG_04636 [Paracoccidioides brasiliensis Pb03]|uniref:Vegetative cell wall protein gp1 n=1 Tax=Paracoccidioides brasiliensis (strain Pb18) TaxID=502780 RepID=C1GBQ0_PARBD|nr:uncharacterized protein PADG_05051 [Paracoccidioides brasiliensis Pb18]EEH22425.1 hypothetical protein PABG_04636 [Paracoccidioides brasiliensis Pb03]EEH48972.2 hypothetical protein PADG_05051 [Paracoccidioides brasiliensis Pb18]